MHNNPPATPLVEGFSTPTSIEHIFLAAFPNVKSLGFEANGFDWPRKPIPFSDSEGIQDAIEYLFRDKAHPLSRVVHLVQFPAFQNLTYLD